MGIYIYPFGSTVFTGGTVSGDTNFQGNLSAATYYSGATELTQVITNLINNSTIGGDNVGVGFPIFSAKTSNTLFFRTVGAGSNLGITTGDTIYYYLNDDISLNTITANTLSSTTLYGSIINSGNTNINHIFSHTGHTHEFSTILNTAHTHDFSTLLNTAHTHDFSEITNTGHTHEFSTILNTAHTHSISQINELANVLSTKVNKSGDTMTGPLFTTVLSANTLFSGSSNIGTIFSHTGHTHEFATIINTAHTHSVSQIEGLPNILNTKVNVSGDTMTGQLFAPSLVTNSLSAVTIQSNSLTGSTAQMVVASTSGILFAQSIPDAGQSTIVRNGLNTYTAGTEADYSVNVSALTIATLSVSGNGVFSGSLSGGSSFSSNTLFSGVTNLNNLFSHTGHTHEFSTILNTAHTHSIANIDELTSILNTKVNRSGDTMTGQLNITAISGTSISADTFYSGSTLLSSLLGGNVIGTNLGNGVNVFSSQTGNNLYFSSISGGTGISIESGDTITINSVPGSEAASIVVIATTTNISNVAYHNGINGVGAILSGTTNGTFPNLDGIVILSGYTVLIKNQTNQLHNGIYYVNDRGSASSRFLLTRDTASDEMLELSNQLVFIGTGSTQKGRYYRQVTADPQPGIDNIVYDLLGGVNTYVLQLATSAQVQRNGQIPTWTNSTRTLTKGDHNFVRNPNSNFIGINVGPIPVSTLDISGSTSLGSVHTVFSSFTISDWHKTILASANTSDIIITLSAATLTSRREWNINKIDSTNNRIIISGISSTIDGQSFISLVNQWDTTTIKSNGVNYYSIVKPSGHYFTNSGGTVTGGTIFVSGITASTMAVVSLSGGGTLMVVTDNLGNLSTQAIPSVGQSTIIRNGLNTYTAGTVADYTINISALTVNTIIASGNSVFSGTLSGGSQFSANTIYSGSTNLYQIFSPTGHTHEFSTILNTAHTHSVSEVNNLSNLLNTKVNKSGDTITGQLTTPLFSATSLSATTYFSGSTPLQTIINNSIGNLGTHKIISVNTIVPNNYITAINIGTVTRGFVGNGYQHLIVGGSYNFIGNGNQLKSLGGSYNFIGNGYGNYVGNAASNYGFIGSGSGNKIYSSFSNVINGFQNYVHLSAEYGCVVNGALNKVHSKHGAILNGNNNFVDNFANYSFINSGKNNLIKSSTTYSFILNGVGVVINSGLTNVSVINGNNFTASTSHTVYVDRLNIQSAVTGGDLMLTYDATTKNVHSQNIPIVSYVGDGINTFTAGTPTLQTVNITAATLDNLTVSGSGIFSGTLSGGSDFSANTYYSGTTLLDSLFVKPNENIWEYQPGFNGFRTKNSGNNIYGQFSFGAGFSNDIDVYSTKSVILNGYNNSISSGPLGRYSSILNGKNNTVNLPIVDSGYLSINSVLQRYGSGIIVGGRGNYTNGLYSFIGNGIDNQIKTSPYSTAFYYWGNSILNGLGNKISGTSNYNFISNGIYNIIADSRMTSIHSAKFSKIYSSLYSFISSGLYNTVKYCNTATIISSRSVTLSGCNYTVAIGLDSFDNSGRILNNTLIVENLLLLKTGSTNAFSSTTLSANTIQSYSLSGVSTQMVVANASGILSVQAIPSAGQSTVVRNGTNTYTAGTVADYTVNVSALTISTLNVSGNSVFSGTLSGGSNFSATTYYSGATPFENIFVTSGATSGIGASIFINKIGSVLNYKTISGGTNVTLSDNGSNITINFTGGGSGGGANVDNGLNTYTAGTSSFQSVNISAATLDNLTVSANTTLNTLTANTVSATTVYSGSTNISQLFSHTGHTHTGGIGFVIDNGSSVITTGFKGHLIVPSNAIITSWTIIGDVAGDIVIDVWKDTYANFPPTAANTITGTEKITLSGQLKNQDLSLTSWTTLLSSGDILAFNVDSVATVKRVYVMINLLKY